MSPSDSVSQFQGCGGLAHLIRIANDVTLCLAVLCSKINIALNACPNFEEKSHVLLFNYKGFDECLHRICRARYFQKG